MSSEQKTVLDRVTASIGLGIAVTALYFVYNRVFEAEITAAIGILYPVYQSLKAIESDRADDDKQWLTYWAVFALFIFAELYIKIVLTYVPFYFFIKLALLVWMIKFNGAQWIYDHFLYIVFKKYESTIDDNVSKATQKVQQAAEETKEFIKKTKGN